MMMNEEDRFETDLRAAMASEPAGAELRRRVLERATPRSRRAPGGSGGWLGLIDPRNWRLPALVELGALAAAASLAVGVFAGASGFVLGTSATTAAANPGTTVDLVALAYDDSSIAGDSTTGGSQ